MYHTSTSDGGHGTNKRNESSNKSGRSNHSNENVLCTITANEFMSTIDNICVGGVGGDENPLVHLAHVFGKLKKVANTIFEQSMMGRGDDEGETIEMLWSENYNDVNYPNIYLQAMDRIHTLKELGDVSFN